MADDRAYLEGWEAGAKYIGIGVSTLLRDRKELKEKGIAFRYIKGRPPERRVVIRIWKNLLQAWYMEKI
ncbi:MAG: hypothetical protein ABIJ57_12085 [Pseudomonadota bacterium]